MTVGSYVQCEGGGGMLQTLCELLSLLAMVMGHESDPLTLAKGSAITFEEIKGDCQTLSQIQGVRLSSNTSKHPPLATSHP